MKKPKIGLLPFFLQMYDRARPEMRPRLEACCREISGLLEAQGARVSLAPLCAVSEEFEAAVAGFEAGGVDALVTLHLSYSPSLEALPALKKTRLPIIVLDTTPDYAFGPSGEAGEILYNHGIHGVQDLCSVLKRFDVSYQVCCGHYTQPGVIAEVYGLARAAKAAQALRTARVGQIGGVFAGMGDFDIGPSALAELGVTTVHFDRAHGARLMDEVSPGELEAEWQADIERFDVCGIGFAEYELSARAGLAVRRWMAEEALTGLTINFSGTGEGGDLPVMPFLETCKAMERGCGYAGEGDVFTPAYLTALFALTEKASFAEMFCPDWRGGSVFLSHMGEWNPAIAAGRPVLTQKTMAYSVSPNPAVLYGGFVPGRAAFVNVTKTPAGFAMLAAAGEMLDCARGENFTGAVRGWFRPDAPLEHFLKTYSEYGGGHHGALVYGPDTELLAGLCRFMGWQLFCF